MEKKGKIEFWRDREKGVVDPTLFSKTAQELAEKLAEENRKLNKRTQLRKFYDEVLRLDSEAKAKPDDWDYILPRVHMIVAKAAYAEGRELVSKSFADFIRSSVEQVFEPKDLRVFANFFEAMMGFYQVLRTS